MSNDREKIEGEAGGTALFATPPPERNGSRGIVLAVAGASVLLIGALLLLPRHAKPAVQGIVLATDPYAESLELRGLKMSESTSLSGGKSTYLDGTVSNTGTRTVRDVQLQVLFANDVALPPQVETVPLTVVRAREPYIDTQALRAAPLGAGEEREFRLIFEDIGSNWNQQMPQIRIVRVSTR